MASQRAKDLVNTSVQDMQSGLWAYKAKDLPILREALEIVTTRGENTKVKALTSKIKKLEKESVIQGMKADLVIIDDPLKPNHEVM